MVRALVSLYQVGAKASLKKDVSVFLRRYIPDNWSGCRRL